MSSTCCNHRPAALTFAAGGLGTGEGVLALEVRTVTDVGGLGDRFGADGDADAAGRDVDEPLGACASLAAAAAAAPVIGRVDVAGERRARDRGAPAADGASGADAANEGDVLVEAEDALPLPLLVLTVSAGERGGSCDAAVAGVGGAVVLALVLADADADTDGVDGVAVSEAA